MLVTEETAEFTCPVCLETFEVHGWIDADRSDEAVFTTTLGLKPRCPDHFMTELIITDPDIGYGGWHDAAL